MSESWVTHVFDDASLMASCISGCVTYWINSHSEIINEQPGDIIKQDITHKLTYGIQLGQKRKRHKYTSETQYLSETDKYI